MGKSTAELAASKGGATLETNGMGGDERPMHPAGLYRHEKSGAEVIVKDHPKYGTAQADAAVRVGFEFVRPATAEELRDKILPPTTAAAGNSEDLKGIQARLNALEAENAALKAAAPAETENAALATAEEAPKKSTK